MVKLVWYHDKQLRYKTIPPQKKKKVYFPYFHPPSLPPQRNYKMDHLIIEFHSWMEGESFINPHPMRNIKPRFFIYILKLV